MSSSVMAWTMPATGDRAPFLMFVAVRAIAPVAGMPPKIGLAMFATSRREDEQFAGVAIFAAMVFIFFFSLIFVIPQIVGGWKLLKERPNARTWGIVGSIISCLSFPLGTAAGVFGLVFLFGEAGRQFYLGSGNYASYNPPQPPPPSSWQ